MKMYMNVVAVAVFAIAMVGLLFYKQNKHLEAPAGQIKIAILTPTTHPALQEIERGFKEIVQESDGKQCLFTTFNANGNKTLLRAQAEEMVSGGYDLLFTIGAGCCQTIAELLKKKNVATPHIFTAVDGPEFAQSIMDLNTSSTGVYVKSDYKTEMDIVHLLKPNIKNMLLVYDPTHGVGLEKDKQEIAEYIKKFGITLHAVEIYQTNEIQQKVAALLPSMDVLLILADNTVVAGIDALITLCNRYGVTLFASDLESGKKGAALAYGVTEYESGSEAAQKALEILFDGKRPAELGLRAVTKFRVAVNTATAAMQNVIIDTQIVEQLKAMQVYHD
ncbi:MAG TPA: ABC transporter substrate-binding protein [Candidatus Babeliales bacterium]|nr:ABC transporter substrate-binding protein [Candidatus Babeliales bacterium]